ncbi:Flagellar hook protein FlgE [Anatilimnocola aggregata]|uniref:Flagellar hook protein FlgE n=1 Tax=Anatilimnocola aggregata TaxID=2528021 RepID=A0A517Y9Q7_9BACT|nr:flagellar hook-basal body complex protein [Anatilimnocola aggregata]QDU26965.1 Flagellar hook protein FlgE [Anatilimnocola aggregata]
MGLASALTTALTGMTAAETQVDVVGNNLANSQTVGFKASTSVFATQFLQTQSLGSSPTQGSGGTNPRQTGLGVRVSEITPDFTQGTIEVSANTSDLAIQGDGFFIVEGSQGEQLYTRNGQFKTNSDNELVTTTGNRVLGFGVDDQFDIQTTTLTPITIPLGSAAVAQATQNVFLEGVLSPSGDIADTAGVIQSATLGDTAIPRPDVTGALLGVAPIPNASGVTRTTTEGAGTHAEGATYRYRFAYVNDSGTETTASTEISYTIPVGDGLANNTIDLGSLPAASGNYSQVKIYRTAAGGSNFFELDTVAAGSNYVDDNSVALSSTPVDDTTINGNYSYVVTYYRAGEEESRPSLLVGPQNIVNGRVQLSNLPTPPVPPPGGGFPAYDTIRIYRNLSTDTSRFYLVGEVAPGEEFTDNRTDAAISDLNVVTNKEVDFNGPRVDSNTLLTNVIKRDGLNYEPMFELGTLEFSARKGGRSLESKSFEITATSTVQDLVDFMQNAVGIQTSLDDPQHPIPGSLNNIPGENTALSAGIVFNDGQLRLVSNNGVDNAIEIDISSFKITTPTGEVITPNLGFGKIQDAKGQSAVTDFIVYDTLGIPLSIRVTSVLESVTDSATVYRWYADAANNSPLTGSEIAVGTGLITFDGKGSFVSATNDRVTVQRRNIPSSDPLEFQLDFTSVSGLAQAKSSLAAARQDGSAAGTLSSYIIGEDGTIRGVFSSGVTRDLGQIRLARFANPTGLEQKGQNLFGQGVNSGLPIEGNPGNDGTGKIIAGAVELSNTDIGKNLIDLVLATTQYRGNARVITTAQQLLDELLNLRR